MLFSFGLLFIRRASYDTDIAITIDVFFSTMRIFVLLISIGLCLAADDSLVIDRTWPDGFAGHLVLNPTKSLHGWKLHLHFNSPVDDLQVVLYL